MWGGSKSCLSGGKCSYVSRSKYIYVTLNFKHPSTLKGCVCGVVLSLAYRGVSVRKFQEANIYVTLNFKTPSTLKGCVCGVVLSLAYRGVSVRKFQEANIYVTLNFKPP